MLEIDENVGELFFTLAKFLRDPLLTRYKATILKFAALLYAKLKSLNLLHLTTKMHHASGPMEESIITIVLLKAMVAICRSTLL